MRIFLLAFAVSLASVRPAASDDSFSAAAERGVERASSVVRAHEGAWSRSGAQKSAVERSFSDTRETAACIRSLECRHVFVVAHRGLGFGKPENSRATVSAAVAAGVEIVETDLRVSKDGEMVIMHDANLRRTTSMKGRPEEMTWAELSKAALDRGAGETVPRFQDLYAITRGKTILNLHLKSNSVAQVAKWVAENGSFDDFIFFLETPDLIETAAKVKAQYPAMILMPRDRERPGQNLEKFVEVFGRLPEIVHTDMPDQALVDRIHAGGAKVFCNILHEDKIPVLAGHTAKKLRDLRVDFVQTERPIWLRGILPR